MVMIDSERIEEILLENIKVQKDARDNVDGLVERMVKEDSEKNRIKRTIISEYDARIRLLEDIKKEILE